MDIEQKFKIIFLNLNDYNIILNSMNQQLVYSYDYLKDQNIENFVVEDSYVIFVPDSYQLKIKQQAQTNDSK